jgi:hypothetical protein
MAKNNNWIFWIIGIIVLFLVITQTDLLKPKQTEFATISVQYYNDGVEVIPQKSLFSIVTPPGGSYNQISFSIGATATGKSYSNIRVVSATPTAFLSALPTNSTNLSIGQSKTLFVSSLMTASQFETMPQPVRFWVNISAKDDYTGQTVYVQGSLNLTIMPASSAMWTANADGNSVTKISPTGTMTTYTGTGTFPLAIAFDGTNMWTANYYGNSVTKISPTGTMITYTGTGTFPLAIAFDGTNMWTANADGNSVTKISPTGTMITYTGTGAGPNAIAFDGRTGWRLY